MNIKDTVKSMANVNIFEEAKVKDLFVGRPYYLDYDKAFLLVTDAWKEKVGGIPQGTFLLAFYANEADDVQECLLLRALKPSKLPTDNEVIASMVEYYKDNIKTSGRSNQLDDFTRYSFSFSGLECRILGTFYMDDKQNLSFGADVENYYSAHNYAAYKPMGKVLESIVNFRDGKTIPGGPTDVKIGKVRYSSSLRFQERQEVVPVYVSPQDFIGKRTATFGMTRTGKSNTVKKIIEATATISEKATEVLPIDYVKDDNVAELLDPFNDNGTLKYKVGQIIFDINGEYANKNLQDEGTAIFDMFSSITERYSVLEKDGFKVMKTNFYEDIGSGFELITSLLADESVDYIKSFLAIDLKEPEAANSSAHIRWERKIAAYKCCLYRAGFAVDDSYKVRFSGNKDLNLKCGGDPSKGITLEKACDWFTWVRENEDDDFFINYKKKKGHDWADEELKSILVFLTKKRTAKGAANCSGYKKLNPLNEYHTNTTKESFSQEIVSHLRKGGIVIIDLSQGSPTIQRTYSEKICWSIFNDSMNRFVHMMPNNFIQFYFEEAHNLFPKKDDKDLSQIYNRIAKEGAKLNIGMIYATQEVSSISSNILKNTQNWFIAHLNNDDELKEIRKFYDFDDFCESLVKYSAGSDKGFIRMKTYSNAFIVPVQIDRFSAKEV
ncbi:MAG: hypothetical protein ACFWUA_01830 [Sporanaerobacter sp.]|jgi:hypothetical protein|uniref:ATP-binding protein n=1 Tax=Sporanaerobacter sp. TaxID=2010183 RepID=UPI003A0FBD9E